jgi:hypothetical protein
MRFFEDQTGEMLAGGGLAAYGRILHSQHPTLANIPPNISTVEGITYRGAVRSNRETGKKSNNGKWHLSDLHGDNKPFRTTADTCEKAETHPNWR